MASNNELLQQLYHGSVAVKLRCASQLQQKYASLLLADKDICTELDCVQNYAGLVQSHMEEMRMGVSCMHCASQNGGGCCSLYMAGETDGIQMLMNLLIGVQVGLVRDDGVECCFLGEKGCLFVLKPMFCLNYNCARINDAALQKDMDKLEMLTGQLLRQQYTVEKKLLDFLEREEI